MKLLLCEKCWDVFKLSMEMRQCSCGLVKGMYINNSQAEVTPNAVSIAIGNGSLMMSINDMRKLQKDTEDKAERHAYQAIGRGGIEYAWVRPNSGDGNPHTSLIAPQ